MKTLKYLKLVWLFIALSLVSCGRTKEQSFVYEMRERLELPKCGYYSDDVIKYVFDYIRENPVSLEYTFEEDLPHIQISTSNDGKVRAYCLDRNGFEGDPSLGFECKTLLQYRLGEDVFCKEYDNFNGYVNYICHIDSVSDLDSESDSDRYYLFETYNGFTQGANEMYNLYVYEFDNNKPHKVKGCFVNRDRTYDNLELFWNNSGKSLDSASFTMENPAFVYNRFHNELYVLKDIPQDGEPLKYHQYVWTGQRFELKKFDEPLEFYNDKYFIRIEQQNENFWTYKSWNSGKMNGEPDLIIKGGAKQYWLYDDFFIPHDEWVTDDESSPLIERFVFFNNGYRYECYEDWRLNRKLYLYVYDPTDTMIYDELFTLVSPREED